MDFDRGDFIVSEEDFWPCPDCDNQPEIVREKNTYSLRCTGCNRRTDEYATIAEAELAWKNDIEMEYPDICSSGHDVVIRTIPLI